MNYSIQNNRMVGLLIVAVFAMAPLYVIPSGGLHIVDIPIACLSFIVFLSARFGEVEMSLDSLTPFIPFVAWALIVDSYYAITTPEYKPYMLGVAQSVYNFYLLMLFTIIFSRILSSEDRISYLYVGLVAACLSPWLIGAHSALARSSLSFNNPNQLAYYALLLLLVLIFVSNEITTEKQKMTPTHIVVYGIVFLCCNIFTYISGSRAGTLAVGMLDIYVAAKLLRMYKRKIIRTTWLTLSATIAICICLIYVGTCSMQYKQNDLLARFDKKQLLDTDDIYHRTLGMLSFKSEFNIIFGNGGIWKQEAITKVTKQFKKEVHNSILGVLNDYGIVGCLLFTIGAIIFVIRLHIYNKWILMIPLLMYNMSHYGLRFRLLWIAMALVSAISIFRHRNVAAFVYDDNHQPMILFPEMR